jgi:hypothetical protein
MRRWNRLAWLSTWEGVMMGRRRFLLISPARPSLGLLATGAPRRLDGEAEP